MCKCDKKSKKLNEIKYVKYVGFDDCSYIFRELVCAKTTCENGRCTINHKDLKIKKTSFVEPRFTLDTYYELRPENLYRSKCEEVIYTYVPLEVYNLNNGSPQLLVSCDDKCDNINSAISGIRGLRYDALGQPQSLQDTLFVNLCSSYEDCDCKYYGIRYLRVTAQVVCDINIDYGFVICQTESCDINNSNIITPLLT